MKLTGGQIIAEYLIRQDVPYIIGIPGHGCLGLVDAFLSREDKIKVLQVKQEMSAVHMADGYFRVTGQPLAVFTSIGPGAINTAIGVATAFVDSTAVLVITGAAHTYMRGKGVLQEIEQKHDADFPSIMEPITKRSWRVDAVEQLPAIMRRAFELMLNGRPGPVHIDLPMNVQCDAMKFQPDNLIKTSPKKRPSGDPREIEKTVGLLLKAKRPVILAGGGTLLSEAWNELQEVAELTTAAVITTFEAKGVFPNDHLLWAGLTGSKGTTCGLELASKADVLLAVGCRFADETTSSYRQGISFSIPPTKLIQVDIDVAEIGKNYPVEIGIVGDAQSVLAQIKDGLKEMDATVDYQKNAYFQEIQQAKGKWLTYLTQLQNADLVPVTISRVLKEIREFLDRDAFVVSSSGNTQAQILQEFPFYEPRTNITTAGFSTMGFTLPASLGVKLAAPRRQVIGIVGDGDFLMTIQELATAVQLNLPVVIIVCNNSGWISIRDLQMGVLGYDRAIATDFYDCQGEVYSPDFKAIAEAFGCYAERISRGEEIQGALKRAFDSGKPSVIEVIVNRNYPHTGSPPVGWWDVPIPTYLEDRRKKYEKQVKEEVLI